MTASAPTIIELKTAFLREQVRKLSTPLQVPAEFSATQDVAFSDSTILPTPKTIEKVVRKVNQRLKQHNRLVYGPRALRHVAEQIDRLYEDLTVADFPGVPESWTEQNCDYTLDDVISQLPEVWDDSKKGEESLLQLKELRDSLVDLSARRKLVRERLETCKSLKVLTSQLGEKDEIQQNLISRNGKIELELERMRRLMIRVERGVSGLVNENSDAKQTNHQLFNSEKSEEIQLLSLFA